MNADRQLLVGTRRAATRCVFRPARRL